MPVILALMVHSAIALLLAAVCHCSCSRDRSRPVPAAATSPRVPLQVPAQRFRKLNSRGGGSDGGGGGAQLLGRVGGAGADVLLVSKRDAADDAGSAAADAVPMAGAKP